MRPSKCRIDEHGRECTKCGQYKLWDEYHKAKHMNTGYMPRCKQCLKTPLADMVCPVCDGRFQGRRSKVYCSTECKPNSCASLSGRAREAANKRAKYSSNLSYNLECRMRTQLRRNSTLMRMAINRGQQSPTLEDRLGYSIAELRSHLESLFTDGMSWGRFDEIHIDHKIPLSSFSLDIESEYNECWSLSNLQPLWAIDNQKKGDRMLTHNTDD